MPVQCEASTHWKQVTTNKSSPQLYLKLLPLKSLENSSYQLVEDQQPKPAGREEKEDLWIQGTRLRKLKEKVDEYQNRPNPNQYPLSEQFLMDTKRKIEQLETKFVMVTSQWKRAFTGSSSWRKNYKSVAPEGDQAQHFPYYCNVYNIITELYIIFVTIM